MMRQILAVEQFDRVSRVCHPASAAVLRLLVRVCLIAVRRATAAYCSS
jgi:hypothetical protein